MGLAQQMFAIAPATGPANLSGEQKQLLVGKARWIAAVAEAGQQVVPTICITRMAWEQLQDERDDSDNPLRTAWVATLFKLVGASGAMPVLAVRTSAAHHSPGLMQAVTGIIAPAKIADSVDIGRPLAKAIDRAFASYTSLQPVWAGAREQTRRDQQIVVVQAMAKGDLVEFSSRDLVTGAPGPAAPNATKLPSLPENATELASVIDRVAGMHMNCLVAIDHGDARLVSARPGMPSAVAELEAAVNRVEKGYWSPRLAVAAIDVNRVPQLLHPMLAANPETSPIGHGIGVSPGAASGVIVFTAEDAARVRARGKHCILVAVETGPSDIDGITAATGVLTARGGQNSHAAIIARVSGKPCVSGVRVLQVDPVEMTCSFGSVELKAGDAITIDGSNGEIYSGRLALSQPHIGGAIGKLLDWSDGTRTIAVRTNVETADAAITALSFGAEGIGLARSEHMFTTNERIMALRHLILSENASDRADALKGLVKFQTGDYAALFKTMPGKPVTVRLFDPPLHEFLPRSDDEIEETASALGLGLRNLRQRLDRLTEVNPMLGHRGCRLAITHPEILQMQVHAVFAGQSLAIEDGADPVALEIMVPFVTSVREVNWVRTEISTIAERERARTKIQLDYSFGTMIELPRAALRAGEIAPLVDFFSFGTNDLTQTTYGISRDDAPAFLATYKRRGLYDDDPFATIDTRGVGELIKIAIERGRAANPNLVIGICGEHAGDPASLNFFAGLGIDYVSCSPYQVPVARLALAQAQQEH